MDPSVKPTFSDLTDVLFAIQQGRKYSTQAKSLELKQRIELLRGLFSSLQGAGFFDDPGFGISSLKSYWASSLESVAASIDEFQFHKPTGLVTALLPQVAFKKLGLELILESILSGSALILKFSEPAFLFFQALKKVLEKSALPAGLVQVVCGNSGVLGELLTNHPSIQAVVFFGQRENFQEISKASEFLNKKWMAGFGGPTTSLLLDSADLEKFSSEIFRSLQLSEDLGPWTSHRIYTVESKLKDLQSVLLKKAENLGFISLKSSVTAQDISHFVAQIKSEQGKILWGGATQAQEANTSMQAAIVQDLPNCSILHQAEFDFPVIFLGSVKYAYELAKWVNNDPKTYGVQIFGETTAAFEFSNKILSGEKTVNDWLVRKSPVPFGLGQSSFGLRDRGPFGDFWSDDHSLLMKN